MKTKRTSEVKPARPGFGQTIYEKALGGAVWILALVHMLSALSRYIVDLTPFLIPFERWFTTGLIAAGLVYLALSLTVWREFAHRLRGFFRKLGSPVQIYCIILFFWYILTCFINEKVRGTVGFADNDWWLLDTAVNCIILFSLPRIAGKRAKAFIDALLHLTALAGTVIAVYALHSLFTLNVVQVPAGGQIGMSNIEALYLGCHYNISAAIELSLVLICIYMLFTQKLFVKILYAAGLAVHTYVLLLNNSRAGFVACCASFALTLFLLLWNVLNRKPAVLRWLLGFTAAAAAVGVMWVLRPLAFQLFENVTHFSELLAAQSSSLAGPLSDTVNSHPALFYDSLQLTETLSRSLLLFPVSAGAFRRQGRRFIRYGLPALLLAVVIFVLCPQMLRSDPVASDRVSGTRADENFYRSTQNAFLTEENRPQKHLAADEGDRAVRKLSDPMNREPIWKSAVKTMKSDPIVSIFGVTPVGVSVALQSLGGLYFAPAHAHNEVLQMGVSMGIPMMVLYVAFIVYMTVKSIRIGLIEGRKLFAGAYIIPVVFAGLSVLTLVEAYLFGYFSIMSSLYFLFCGWTDTITGKKQNVK